MDYGINELYNKLQN